VKRLSFFFLAIFLFFSSFNVYAVDGLAGLWAGTQKLEEFYLDRINTISPIEYTASDFTYATESIEFKVFQNEKGEYTGYYTSDARKVYEISKNGNEVVVVAADAVLEEEGFYIVYRGTMNSQEDAISGKWSLYSPNESLGVLTTGSWKVNKIPEDDFITNDPKDPEPAADKDANNVTDPGNDSGTKQEIPSNNDNQETTPKSESEPEAVDKTHQKEASPEDRFAELDRIFGLDKDFEEEVVETQDRLEKIAEDNPDYQVEKLPASAATGLEKIHLVRPDESVPADKDEEPGTWFKIKYYLNQKILDPLVDKAVDKIPLVNLYSDKIKSEKDEVVFQSEDEKTFKTMEDIGVDKTSAEAYNRFAGFDEKESELAPAKNLFQKGLELAAKPVQMAVKPFFWTLDKMKEGCKKMFSHSAGKEQTFIEKEMDKRITADMSDEEIKSAIEVIKFDYDEFESYERSYNFLRNNSKGKYTNDTERFNLIVNEHLKKIKGN